MPGRRRSPPPSQGWQRAGAGALGLGLTAALPNVLEDALALGFAAAVGYLALLNLPLRRAEAKAKVERVAGNFAKARACGVGFRVGVMCAGLGPGPARARGVGPG